jgi:hypothetical protein
VRGKEKGKAYLRISDDGEGVPRTESGEPDFAYVATHIYDSIKRRMKESGVQGVQGEFGIGLLSFWTVGRELVLASSGADGHVYDMHLVREKPGYTVRRCRLLFPEPGTRLTVSPLLPGIRQLSGEKLQWYLASELRDRIRSTGVAITVIDRQARKEFRVEPREFEGRLLHEVEAQRTSRGDIYLELYLAGHSAENDTSLYRNGTRVLTALSNLDEFQREPWTSGHLQGIVDAPFLRLTPGTRDGIIRDEAYTAFVEGLRGIEPNLKRLIDEQRQAEEQRASRQILKSVQKAIREALLALPVATVRVRRNRSSVSSMSGRCTVCGSRRARRLCRLVPKRPSGRSPGTRAAIMLNAIWRLRGVLPRGRVIWTG